jgi:hypothetical protein
MMRWKSKDQDDLDSHTVPYYNRIAFNIQRRNRHAAWAQMTAAGVQLMNWFGVACELHRDWRNDIESLGVALFQPHPELSQPITSYLAKNR